MLDYEFLTETLELERTMTNIEISIVINESPKTVLKKITNLAKETSDKVTGKIKHELDNVKSICKMLKNDPFDDPEYELSRENKTKILKDPDAFSNAYNFLKTSQTMKYALFTPSDAKQYSKFLLNGKLKSKKIDTMFENIRKEMNSSRAKIITGRCNDYINITVTKSNYESTIVPMIKSLEVATEEFKKMIFVVNKSLNNLNGNISNILNKDLKIWRKTSERREKNVDLFYRTISVVGYASRIVINACTTFIRQIRQLLEHYEDQFSGNNSDNE